MRAITKKPRQANIELLRIVATIMIILLHLLVHGGVVDAVAPFSTKYYILWTLCSFCYIPVNLYALIFAYHQCESTFKTKRMLLLLLEVWFYSVTIFLVLYLTSSINLTFENMCYVFLPTLNRSYWYITVYFGTYILSPFLNWVINRINQKQHLLLLTVLVILFSVWPSFAFLSSTLNFGGGFGIVWFIVLYFLGAYIRKYYQSNGEFFKLLAVYLLFAIALPVSKFLIAHFSNTTGITAIPDDIFYNYNSILVLGASAYLFLLFLNIKVKRKSMVNTINCIASATLGIYLIHDNTFVRNLLWDALKINEMIDQSDFYFIMFGTVLVIFFICFIIDIIRQRVFNIFRNNRCFDKFCNHIEKKIFFYL